MVYDPGKLTEIVAELGKDQYQVGSAYPVSPHYLLSAYHVLGNLGLHDQVAYRLAEQHHTYPKLADWPRATVVWLDRELDAVLLKMVKPLEAGFHVHLGFSPPRRTKAFEGGGFPIGTSRTVRDGLGLNGQINPLGEVKSRKLELQVGAEPLAVCDWSGLSGGPVFVDGLLVGHVLSDKDGYAERRLKARSLHQLMGEESFFRLLQPALDEVFLARVVNTVTNDLASLHKDSQARLAYDLGRTDLVGNHRGLAEVMLHRPLEKFLRCLRETRVFLAKKDPKSPCGDVLSRVMGRIAPILATSNISLDSRRERCFSGSPSC